jgi:DNA polymerase-3 subunit chi
MTEIRFYHLTQKTPEQALPDLLIRALESGKKIVVKFGNKDMMEMLDKSLWTSRRDAFIPHGTKADPDPEFHPIWLTTGDDAPNAPDTFISVGAELPEDLSVYSLVCDLFSESDSEMVSAARKRWKTYKDSDYTLTYWQQGEKGGWEKKAG